MAQAESSSLRGKRILITGATGFLGSALATRLVALGAKVSGASRRAEPLPGLPAMRMERADLSIQGDVERLFSAVRPQIVYHLTSDSRGGRGMELVLPGVQNDIVATANALVAAAGAKAERFVMTSSLEEPTGGDIDRMAPVSPYAAAKLACAMYGRMFRRLYGLDVRIVRPMMTYGPGQKDYKLVPATILSLLRGQPIKINSGARLVDWVYLDDVIDGMLKAASVETLEQTIDLGSGELVPVAAVAGEIARQIGAPQLVEFGTGERGEEIRRIADANAAETLIGFRAQVGIAEGVAKTIVWYRARLG